MLIAMIPGSSKLLYADRHVAAADHDAAEDEDKHHRLQEGLQQQRNHVAPSHMRITRQQGAKKSSSSFAQAPSGVVQKQIFQAGLGNMNVAQFRISQRSRLAISGTSEPPRSA